MATVVAFFGALMLATPVRAVECVDHVSNVLKDSDIRALDLTERVNEFSKAMQVVSQRSPNRIAIDIVVRDCPYYGTLNSFFSFAEMPAIGIPRTYSVHITAARLRNTEDTQLLRDARREACVIVSGILDMPQASPPAQGEESPAVVRCMIQESVRANDIQYAEWLARTHHAEVPQLQAEVSPPQAEIDRAIEQLKDIGAPPGMLDSLEKLKRSFDDFPPRSR
ncbi:MAG TPA: hypothetical protein VMH91_01335 [Candidatus Paceibacterota bacterium]|nr:hypothetical protein [Candidatus Paceibacterota bacterium]